MITARSDIVDVPPGRYQISTIIFDLVRHYSKRRRKTTNEYRREYKRKKALEYNHAKKAATRRMLAEIPNLPDNDLELWNRPDPSNHF